MAFKPSQRRKDNLEEELVLNLNPMMDMFAVLIPALLMLSAVVEVSIIHVSSPSINSEATPPPAEDKPPLALTVIVTDKGFTISASGQMLAGPEANGPTIPVRELEVGCSRFRGTWPPPRAKNKEAGLPPCQPDEAMSNRRFWMYDTQTLTQRMIEIKNANESERQIIISADPGIEYETIVDTLDATRLGKLPDGTVKALFDEVMVRPSI